MITIKKTQNNKQLAKHIGTKLPAEDFNKINRLVEAGAYISNSDFLREAIRDKLKTIDIINEREISNEQAKQEIYNYCKNNNTTYLSEIANNLELPLIQVNGIVEELISNGNIKEVWIIWQYTQKEGIL